MSQAPPGVIPYVDVFTGESRVVTLRLAAMPRAPFLGVDGRTYLVFQGEVHVEVPCERAVHLAVWSDMESGTRASSSLLLPAGNQHVTLAVDIGAFGLGRGLYVVEP